jgi:hypothetical protein
MSDNKENKPDNLQVIKEDPNLITVFVCFLKSGLRFTRYDTNNVGLAFIDEIKKHNPNFKPVKVQQRERDKIYTVNAYPREFEQLIMSLIEEYRKKNNLEYRLKKSGPRGRGGSRHGGGRQGGYNQRRDQRGGGYQSRPRREGQGGYNQRREGEGNRDGGYRPRRNYDDQRGSGYNRNRGYDNDNRGNSEGGYRPRRNQDQNYNRDGYTPNRYPREDYDENKRPRRPRRDTD